MKFVLGKIFDLCWKCHVIIICSASKNGVDIEHLIRENVHRATQPVKRRMCAWAGTSSGHHHHHHHHRRLPPLLKSRIDLKKHFVSSDEFAKTENEPENIPNRLERSDRIAATGQEWHDSCSALRYDTYVLLLATYLNTSCTAS